MTDAVHIPTPPFAKAISPNTRGHVEQQLGSGIVCQLCPERKPKRGGWQKPCAGDKRVFLGGECA